MDDARLNEIIRYTQTDLARRDLEDAFQSAGSTGGEVHIHLHAAPDPVATVQPATGAVEQPDVLAKYAPYYLLILGGVVILGGLAVVLVMLTPVLLAILGSVVSLVIASAAAVGGVAVAMAALSSVAKNVRKDGAPTKRRGRR